MELEADSMEGRYMEEVAQGGRSPKMGQRAKEDFFFILLTMYRDMNQEDALFSINLFQ
jgi:hypothetical protein